jgi:alkylhydroperoxidase/carboxymuconolactone decarboxylase family protein YurZ
MTPEQEQLLRRLAIHDSAATAAALASHCGLFALDARMFSLARVAASIASESSLATLQWTVEHALANGACDDDVIDVLLAVAPIVGLARLTAAAPEVGLALGYDVVDDQLP